MPEVQPPDADPERLSLIVRVDDGADGGRYLVLRRVDTELEELPALESPRSYETLRDVVADTLRQRLGLEPAGEPLLGALRVPAMMGRRRSGARGTGWRRAVAVRAGGTLDLRPPLTSARLLPLDEAAAALATDAERALLRAGAELLPPA